MRSILLGLCIVTLASIGASAKEISLQEWTALAAQNKAQLAAMEQANIARDQSGVNPFGTPEGIAYMKAHPYSPCDLVAGKDGFTLPGWQSMCGNNGNGGNQDGGSQK